MSTRSSAPSPPPEPAKAEAQGSLAATCIRALLDRAGLPRHRQSAHIAGLLSLSYHQAHRRMTGIAPWSRTWWSPSGDSVVEWLPAAKAAFANSPDAMDERFDRDHAAWVISEQIRLAAEAAAAAAAAQGGGG